MIRNFHFEIELNGILTVEIIRIGVVETCVNSLIDYARKFYNDLGYKVGSIKLL